MKINIKAACITYRFGGIADPSIPRIKDTKDPDMRDKLHMPGYSDYQKSFFPEHITKRRPFTLYNVFSYLPKTVISTLSKLPQGNDKQILSDNVYLPKLSANGIAVYDSLKTGQKILMVENATNLVPFVFVALSQHPATTLMVLSFLYMTLMRETWVKLARNSVIKMELVPETEEILIQKVGPFGWIKTSRVKITDIEKVSKTQISQTIFYRFARSAVDFDMIFRLKSSGELLLFHNDGLWYEEGLSHELMI